MSDSDQPEARSDEIPAIQSQLAGIFSELKQQRSDVSLLRHEVRDNSMSVGHEVKKLKIDHDIVWKRTGNKVQFDFNGYIQDLLSQALWANQNDKVDYACELINEALDKLKKRKKLIRIADTSECGWDTVKQYESNPIASDSDDENKLQKAENRAIKRRKAKFIKSSGRGKPFPSTARPPVCTITQPGQRSSGATWAGSASQHFPARGGFKNVRGLQGQGNHGTFGACFACGEFSHFRRDCPYDREDAKSEGSSGRK